MMGSQNLSDKELIAIAKKALSYKPLLRAERDNKIPLKEGILVSLPLFSLNVVCTTLETGLPPQELSMKLMDLMPIMHRVMEIQNCKRLIPTHPRIEYTTSQASRIFELAGFSKEVPKSNVYIRSINPVGYYMYLPEMEVNTIHRIFPWYCLPGHTAIQIPKHK